MKKTKLLSKIISIALVSVVVLGMRAGIDAKAAGYHLDTAEGFCTDYAHDYVLSTNLATNFTKGNQNWTYSKCLKRMANEDAGTWYTVNQVYKFTLAQDSVVRLQFTGKSAAYLINSDVKVGIYDINGNPEYIKNSKNLNYHILSFPQDNEYINCTTGKSVSNKDGKTTAWIDKKFTAGTYYIYCEGSSSSGYASNGSNWLDSYLNKSTDVPDSVTIDVIQSKSSIQKTKPNISKITQKKQVSTLKLKAAALFDDSKYEIQYKEKGAKKWKSVKISAKKTLKTKKLSKGKKYQIRIREYVQEDGKTYYSKWSQTKTIKVK